MSRPAGVEKETAGAPADRASRARAAALLALLVVLFLLPWWNASFGGTLDGYLPFYGHRMLLGETPYRDFYLHLPPLSIVESMAIDALSGDHTLIAHRVVGALERVALAVVLFFWLARSFRRETAFLGAFAAVVAASGDGTDVLYLYNYQSLLWASVAGWAGAVALEGERVKVFPWLASGAAAGLCLLAKQTTGLGVIAALGAALALVALRRFGAGGALGRGAWWAAGLGLALAPAVYWLASHGALGAAVGQVFLDATGKKGPILDLLLRVIEITFTTRAYAVPATLAIVLLIGLVPALLARDSGGSAPDARALEARFTGRLWRRALACGLACVAAIPLARLVHPGIGWLRLPQRVGLYLALFGCGAVALHGVVAALRRLPSNVDAERLVLATVGFATAYMLSLSWAASEAMAAPGLGLIVAGAAAAGARLPRWIRATPGVRTRWRAPVVVVAVMALALGVSWQRRIEPYWFAGWREPPLDAPRATHAPRGLAGFSLSQESAAFIDRLVEDLDRHSRPTDRVFIFSAAPVFYLLGARESETFASLHWYDVTTDAVCRRDLAALVADPPAVLVLWEESEEELILHEKVFRAGHPSGQREMSRGLHDLAARLYTRIDDLAAPGGAQVEVFARTPAP